MRSLLNSSSHVPTPAEYVVSESRALGFRWFLFLAFFSTSSPCSGFPCFVAHHCGWGTAAGPPRAALPPPLLDVFAGFLPLGASSLPQQAGARLLLLDLERWIFRRLDSVKLQFFLICQSFFFLQRRFRLLSFLRLAACFVWFAPTPEMVAVFVCVSFVFLPFSFRGDLSDHMRGNVLCSDLPFQHRFFPLRILSPPPPTVLIFEAFLAHPSCRGCPPLPKLVFAFHCLLSFSPDCLPPRFETSRNYSALGA